ncbi:hypothetical protein C8Q75DRAFT_811686 [Abortiporus biennis]|nr:hypothetical protein C8Q75DRAFT_811686 [Abortiporus biennis]
MSGESSKRSNLVDITYQQLHSILSGQQEGTTPEQLSDYLKPRLEQLKNVSEPFGKPSDASKKKVESGSVALRDGVILRVEDADKAYVFAISKKFNIDEVEALVLLRSFLYNEGLPFSPSDDSTSSLIDELVEAITPFYYSERLFLLRVLIPLFRANAVTGEYFNGVANEYLPQIYPDAKAFVAKLIEVYMTKAKTKLPTDLEIQPKKAVQWVKQNAREQLVLLEVLFWTMWDYCACSGPTVIKIYETAYTTNLGSAQENGNLLLDAEGVQLTQDIAALWILLMLEVLELERVAEPGGMQVPTGPSDKDIYWSSPDDLQKIHNLVVSHEGSQFAGTYLAWAFVLSRLVTVCGESKEIPPAYSSLVQKLVPQLDRSYAKEREPTHILMARSCLDPDVGLFKLLLTLLTNSPVYVTSMAWRTGSTATDPNAVAFRSVLKGLVIALVELIPAELIPDFDMFVEVWIALFGRSESKSVTGICCQFWQSDWAQGISRRAVFDVARSRFPIQCKYLVRLLRSMTATGFLDTDVLSTADHGVEGEDISEERDLCARHVFFYFDKLPTYTQVIPISACTGAHAIYEKVPERYTSSSAATCLTYINLKPIKLPGGSILPVRTVGHLLSETSDFVVISWKHEHSGWKLLLELLTDYVNRRRVAASGGGYHDISFGRRKDPQHPVLRLEDIGVEMDPRGDDLLVTDLLDLVRSVAQDNPNLAEQLLDSMEAGEPVVAHSTTESSPPDIVQLTTMILEEALSRSSPQNRSPPPTPLITSAMSVLAALLSLPKYSNRVWLYIRSTASLFGSDRNLGVTSSVLAAERITGHYTMTLALLHLVQSLFNEASSSVLTVMQDSPKLQVVKEDVLMRAARFVHADIWIEHSGWKYAQLGDRFEIGKRVSTFYSEILKHSPPSLQDAPFSKLSQAVCDALLVRATPSAIQPIISAITSAGSVLTSLYTSRRYGDARRLVYMLESHLLLTRIVLNCKQKLPPADICLLEQALCTRGVVGASTASADSKFDPVDALAGLVKERSMGAIVPVESMQVLFALCSSLSTCEGSQATIIGHLSDPEGTVASLVRIVLHPYDDVSLRNAVWNFITLAVDKEPALANLFVGGHFGVPSIKGKERAADSSVKSIVALTVALDMLEQWKELWESNPQLLASIMRFLDVVWEHGHEHKASLEPVREDAAFFKRLTAIVEEELGPVPDYRTENFLEFEGDQRSDLHEAVSVHAYRTIVKSHALHILALDIKLSIQSQGNVQIYTKPVSYISIQNIFKTEDQLSDLVSEAASRTYDPSLHDELMELFQTYFPTLTLEQLQVQEPIVERDFGDDFSFSMTLLQFRLQPYISNLEKECEEALRKLASINLNLSLAHAQTTLTLSWQNVLRQVVPFLRGDAAVRPIVLSIAASISSDIANEKRSGDMMSNVHNSRLSLLLSLLEVAWFSASDKSDEIKHFITLVKNVRGIVTNPAQPPIKSFLGQFTVPFHRIVLQIAYFCVRHCRTLWLRPKGLNAEQRLAVHSLVEALLALSVDALRSAFDAARTKLDLDLDQDMELLVAVFEICTKLDFNTSPVFWLTRCQETDVIRASLQLFSRMDVVGYSDVPLLRARKQALYAPHVLTFHMTLASITASAERLASEGVVTAYSENPISNAIKAGSIDIVLPELPGERSPAHSTYCSMLSVISGVTNALGRHGHYFDNEASGLIQLYGDQIHRALSWTINDSLSLPLMEEIEQVVNLFSSIAQNSVPTTRSEGVQRALNFFTEDALLLLQQVNYALTHPNHLASMFEPITSAERLQIEADSKNSTSVSAPSDVVDPMKRPFLAKLVHRMFKLSSSILSTLLNISGGEMVLIGEQEDWPHNKILVVPHSKVVLGEPASIGTLLELGNCSLDVLRRLVDRPATQAITPDNNAEKPLDVRESVGAARSNLEGVLFYAVTQLALWLAKPDLGTSNDMEMDDNVPLENRGQDNGGDRNRAKSSSMTMAERLRRGMSGEMASDIQALLVKSKPVIAKSATVLGTKTIDLTPILSRFVQEKILAS